MDDFGHEIKCQLHHNAMLSRAANKSIASNYFLQSKNLLLGAPRKRVFKPRQEYFCIWCLPVLYGGVSVCGYIFEVYQACLTGCTYVGLRWH